MYTERTDAQVIIGRMRKIAALIVVAAIVSIGANILGFIRYL